MNTVRIIEDFYEKKFLAYHEQSMTLVTDSYKTVSEVREAINKGFIDLSIIKDENFIIVGLK